MAELIKVNAPFDTPYGHSGRAEKNMVNKYNALNIYIPIFASLLSGFLFFAIYNQWIIFRTPWQQNTVLSSDVIQKKSVVLHYFYGDKWKSEKQEMLWQENIEKNISHIVNAWLALLDDEHVIAKKTTLQSALVTPSNIAYLSFDHNVLGKEETIFKKWMLIEGLLKTIASNDIAITYIQFLIRHQPLQDVHLDFSMPWPIYGFI